MLADGTPFPARDVAIFLAMGVILLSLLVASVGLPLLTRGLDGELPQTKRSGGEGSVRIAASEAAIRRIEQILSQPLKDSQAAEIRSEAAAYLLDIYRRRLHYGHRAIEDAESVQRLADVSRQLRLEALNAERDELYRLRRMENLDDDLHRQLIRELDLMEASLVRPVGH